MATEVGPKHPGHGFSAATRRFPRSEVAIRILMSRNEAFRDMCEELAEAEGALLNALADPHGPRSARQSEWQELVSRLVAEIQAVLEESQVPAKSR